MNIAINPGLPFHDIPADMQDILENNETVRTRWNSLTDIMRNEWICWVTIVKQEQTRQDHLRRFIEELSNPTGHKSPCCWPGCPHRRPETLKYFKQKK